MFLLLLISFFFVSANRVNAQVPMYYQLLQAYHSATVLSANVPAEITPVSTPVPTPGQILGISTTSTPTPTPPRNIGGDGKIYTIAVLGDSMIDTLQPDLPQLQSALAKYYPNRKFNLLNYGVGGRNIEYGIYRLTNDYEYQGNRIKSLISQNPDIVVVESFGYNNFGNSQAGIDQHWQDLSELTTTLKQKLPKTKIVLAATIAPNSVIFGNGIKDVHFSAMEKIEKTSTIKLYLQNMVNFATSQGFPLADAFHPSLFNNEGFKEFINAGDNLHPSGPGGVFFCDTVADTIYRNKLVD
jgi:hypothetical protein